MRRKLSEGARFRILKRDGFRCRYCGKVGAEAKLHVDHVQPVSAGGTNDPLNLVTACAGCNLGKHARPPEWKHCGSDAYDPYDPHLLEPGECASWNAWDDCTDAEAKTTNMAAYMSLMFAVQRYWGPDGLGAERCFVEDHVRGFYPNIWANTYYPCVDQALVCLVAG